ncbi:MAG TPA: hypothetical protein VLJ88_07690, partial [Propionibacteriaceae bacterium]|nr:hypothetical protein [Propionibacteriaceae bacterium]
MNSASTTSVGQAQRIGRRLPGAFRAMPDSGIGSGWPEHDHTSPAMVTGHSSSDEPATGPEPRLDSTRAVGDALLDLPGVAAGYAAARKKFNERFN